MKLWYAIKPLVGQYITEQSFKNHVQGENVWIDGVLATSHTQQVSGGQAVKIGSCIWTTTDWDGDTGTEKEDDTCPHCQGTGRL